MSRWKPDPRTKADFLQDLKLWCVNATLKAYEATGSEDLARRHKLPLDVVKYHRAMLRDGKGW